MTKFLPTLILLAVTCAPVCAQGVSEMGGVYAIPKGGPFGLNKAVNGLFGGATGAINRAVNGGGGGQRSGVVGGSIAPATRMSPGQIAAYTSQAQHAYAAGLAAQKAGKSAEAIKQFGIALSVREGVWGLGDPNIAEIARRQATLLSAAGKKNEAEAAWRKVLASDQRHYGAGAPELAKTLSTLGSLADDRGDAREALNCYKQLFGIQSRHAPDSPDARAARLKVASLSMATGDFTTAESLLKEGMASQESSAQPDKAYEAQLYDAYAALLRQTNRATDAVAFETKAAALHAPPAAEPAPPAASDKPDAKTSP